MDIQSGIDLKRFKAGGFIGSCMKLVADTVIPYQYDVLCDRAPDTPKSHVIANFINAAKALKGEDTGDGFYGMVFQDSDAAKWIEAAAYSLINRPDSGIEEKADELIELIAAAEDEDGYLNTRFTITDRDKRWTNLLEGHELYCAGHMMEAACAYYEATGKDKLLKTVVRNMEHIYDRFVTQKHEGYPGHPEIETALMKLYRTTGDKRCPELAAHFINVRGADPHFYEKEAAARNWSVWGNDPSSYDYQQSGKPVREQSDATGHAVRAVYLYTAMAELAAQTQDKELFAACRRLWESITRRRMYVTGGIGSTVIGEAFSADYDLPPDTAYCETCASVGLIFFASAMLRNEINGEYADIMERAFYNTVLAGMQLDGKRFFYVNPLEAIPGISGVSPTHRHALIMRPGWYACACCPPNAARLIASFGRYACGESADTAYIHMFAHGEISFANGVRLLCTTGYPYDLKIRYDVKSGGRIAIRIPAWSKSLQLSVNGTECECPIKKGYAYLNAADGDVIELLLDGSVRHIYASSRVPYLTGKTAVERGPLVYCFEGADNASDVFSLYIKRDGRADILPADGSGTVKIAVEAARMSSDGGLYTDVPPECVPCTAYAVPYYTWANRGENQMRVWVNEIL